MRILVVDAFTDRPFAGNPAGVCLLDGPADAGWMQSVAAEMRHAETAFLRPLAALETGPGPAPHAAPETGLEADYELRWFTPAVEVDLCGHATLASAHALYETGTVPAGATIRFRTRGGVLTVRPAREPGSGGLLEMDFPAQPAWPAEVPPGLAGALGVPVAEAGRNAQNDLFVLLGDEKAVRELAPDLAALARIDARGVCVTAPATPDPGPDAAPDPGPGSGSYDFVSRFFGPAVGVDEDPVTGSAHCMLAPYWSDRLGRDTLLGYQASGRGGTVRVTVRGDRVTLAGRAVTVLEGTLRV
ncbi:PhzF family phenazine biosynthesis protein [Actinomadura scrupuli]|uniref:PhzF family phenazine biosynthesis protein n=1 Tax=Actinomadura scrupuli TaxID=559629 RepID=UPI003D9582D5